MTIRAGMWVARHPDYLDEDWWRSYCTGVNKKS
jgi:hypothetical protein